MLLDHDDRDDHDLDADHDTDHDDLDDHDDDHDEYDNINERRFLRLSHIMRVLHKVCDNRYVQKLRLGDRLIRRGVW